MILRGLIASVLLLSHASAQNGALTSRRVLRTPSAVNSVSLAQTTPVDTGGFDSRYRLSLSHAVQDKNFYLLSLFQRRPDVRRLLNRNKVLQKLADEKNSALKNAATCGHVACFEGLLRFDDSTIEAVATELQSLAGEPEFKRLAKKDLRPSGVFIKYNRQSDAQMLATTWKDAARGLNRILSVYGLGKDPRYKDIDKVSFDVSSEEYRSLLKTNLGEIKFAKEPLFFEPALNFALKLLEINKRDEAGRYEPLEQGENKAAVQNLKNIHWSDYAYSFILVLGAGPSDSARLSPLGAQRADVGAQLFLARKAPLIILSGGHVHPMQTPYCEAIEMKKYLIEKYKIPEQNILVDPYARHTTTNFRNTARLAFRYRLPLGRTALVTSSESHITAVTSEEFRRRCLNELGYFPMEFIKRVSPVAAEFKPSTMSLFFDSNDPLDP